MSDPRIKQIKIKSGVVKRLAKEKLAYEKEAQQQRDKVAKMKADERDPYEIKKQEEVLQESVMMIPDCNRRLIVGLEDLRKALDTEKDLAEEEDYKAAILIANEAETVATTN